MFIIKEQTSRTPVDVFDALALDIQKNNKLLEAFCLWYLGRFDRSNVRDKRRLMKKAKELSRKYPKMPPSQIRRHKEIMEAGASDYAGITITRWVREALGWKPGRPKKE